SGAWVSMSKEAGTRSIPVRGMYRFILNDLCLLGSRPSVGHSLLSGRQTRIAILGDGANYKPHEISAGR
ncbi:hypothetical protein, partial [Pseudomonas sp. P5_A2_2]